jgi:hypothetical protein
MWEVCFVFMPDIESGERFRDWLLFRTKTKLKTHIHKMTLGALLECWVDLHALLHPFENHQGPVGLWEKKGAHQKMTCSQDIRRSGGV